MPEEWVTASGAPSAVQLQDIERVLLGHGVVLLPTDTIYGLHALAGDAQAIDRIAAMKGRDGAKPFVVLAASIDQLEELGAVFPLAIRDRLANTWPAPLTAIVPLSRPIAASRGASTIASRVPALGWLRDLLSRTGPLASTSANLSGERVAATSREVPPEMVNQVDGIVSGAFLDGMPSSIIDLSAAEPRIVREGAFPFAQDLWKTL